SSGRHRTAVARACFAECAVAAVRAASRAERGWSKRSSIVLQSDGRGRGDGFLCVTSGERALEGPQCGGPRGRGGRFLGGPQDRRARRAAVDEAVGMSGGQGLAALALGQGRVVGEQGRRGGLLLALL